MTRLPLSGAHFDAIICTQVLEHIPASHARRELLSSFAGLLRPAGELLLTVYNFNPGRPREGVHESGIFFHCFDPTEHAPSCRL